MSATSSDKSNRRRWDNIYTGDEPKYTLLGCSIPEADMAEVEKPIEGGDGGDTTPPTEGNKSPANSSCFRALVQKIEVDLLAQKAYFFTFGYAFGCIGPFLDGYFKQRGMTDDRIRTITGVRPFICFFSIPLVNLAADRFQKRKVVLLTALMALILCMSITGIVPPPEEKSCAEILEHIGNNTNVSQVSHLVGGGGGGGGRKRSLPRMRTKRQSDDFLPIEDNNDSDISVLVDDLEGDVLHDRSWLYTESSLDTTFLVFMVLCIIGEMLTAPTGSLADTATFYSLGDKRLELYGQQRACAGFAHILSVFPAIAILKLSQVLLERCGVTFLFHHYKILFFIFDGWMLLAFLVVYFKFEYGDDNMSSTFNPKGLLRMLKSPHYLSILGVTLYFGMCHGLIRGFLFGYIRELGGDETLLGLATFLLYGSEVVVFCISHWLIRALGFVWVVYFGLICYIIRFLMYALITNPWGILPAEVLQGLSYAAVWASLTTYLAKAVTSDNYATVLGVLHAVYWGLGNGLGNFVGGAMIDVLGMQRTYWVFCIASVFVLIIFGTLQKIFPSGPGEKIDDYSELEETKLIADKQGAMYTSPPEKSMDETMTSYNDGSKAVGSIEQGLDATDRSATSQEGALDDENRPSDEQIEKQGESDDNKIEKE